MNKTLLLTMFDKDAGVQSVAAGEVLFRQGDGGSRMYVLLDGAVRLSVGGIEIETLEAGALFGEMALIDEQPRSATAESLTSCRVVPIDARRFEFLVRQTPGFALHVMQVMSHRLRRMDMKVAP